ncbi:hypothetical protein HOY80DRAFT_960807 [Tuber brumale]|nr:hypothetical protein HOY80DRAFT_960807 [Tuber brumale]
MGLNPNSQSPSLTVKSLYPLFFNIPLGAALSTCRKLSYIIVFCLSPPTWNVIYKGFCKGYPMYSTNTQKLFLTLLSRFLNALGWGKFFLVWFLVSSAAP